MTCVIISIDFASNLTPHQNPNPFERSDQNPPQILPMTLQESSSVERTDAPANSELIIPPTASKDILNASSSKSSTGATLAAHDARKRRLQQDVKSSLKKKKMLKVASASWSSLL